MLSQVHLTRRDGSLLCSQALLQPHCSLLPVRGTPAMPLWPFTRNPTFHFNHGHQRWLELYHGLCSVLGQPTCLRGEGNGSWSWKDLHQVHSLFYLTNVSQLSLKHLFITFKKIPMCLRPGHWTQPLPWQQHYCATTEEAEQEMCSLMHTWRLHWWQIGMSQPGGTQSPFHFLICARFRFVSVAFSGPGLQFTAIPQCITIPVSWSVGVAGWLPEP